MDRFFDENFAEIIKAPTTYNKVWYLLHFGVQKRTNKVRLVFNAAARSGTTSLNNLLLTGPDYLKSLIGVLMRFR